MITYNGNSLLKLNFGLYEHDEINHKKTKKHILRFMQEHKTEFIKVFKDIGITFNGFEYYSPKYYNFENDAIDIKISHRLINKQKLKKIIQKNKDMLQIRLDKNKSYDGYTALTVSTVEEELIKLNNSFYEPDILILSELIKDKISITQEDIYDNFVFEDVEQ